MNNNNNVGVSSVRIFDQKYFLSVIKVYGKLHRAHGASARARSQVIDWTSAKIPRPATPVHGHQTQQPVFIANAYVCIICIPKTQAHTCSRTR